MDSIHKIDYKVRELMCSSFAVESNFNNEFPAICIQNMSEPEKRSYADTEKEQNEEVIQEGAEARAEQEVMEAETIRSAEEEEQETVAKEKAPKRKQSKKKTSDSRRKTEQFDITSIKKQLEKQTDDLARIDQVLQPLRRLAKGLNVQSKAVKEINTSVKQVQKQIMKIQKAIQKGKIRRK